MRNIYVNINEDIEKVNSDGVLYRDEAAVSVMDKQFTAKSPRREVVHTTGPIGDIPKDDKLGAIGGMFFQNVGNHASVQGQSFRELESD